MSLPVIYTNTIYKYGIGNDIWHVTFTEPHKKIQLTNELCKNDPSYGNLKYLYDCEMNIICKEYDYICIDNSNTQKNKNIISKNKNIISKNKNIISKNKNIISKNKNIISKNKNINGINTKLETGVDVKNTNCISTELETGEDFLVDVYRMYNKELKLLSDSELVIHYYNYGKHENRICNSQTFYKKYGHVTDDINTYYNLHVAPKKTIYVYSPKIDENCGGICVLHNLTHQLEKKNIFNAQVITYCNLNRTINLNPNICISEDDVVIYPETIYHNPLNAKNVIRLILLGLGIEQPIDMYKNWNLSDIMFQWMQWNKNISKYNQLCIPFFDRDYKNLNLTRDKDTCCIIKKGRLLYDTHIIKKNIEDKKYFVLDGLEKNDIIKSFNTYKFLYSYDCATAYICYAIICGCIPIIEPYKNYTRDEYIQCFMNNGTVKLKHGFAYGNTEEQIKFASHTIITGILEATQLLSEEVAEENIINFIDALDIHYNKKGNVVCKYLNMLTVADVYYN